MFVTVLDQNDNRPQFSQALYTGSIMENSGPSTTVDMVSAAAAESGTSFSVVVRNRTPLHLSDMLREILRLLRTLLPVVIVISKTTTASFVTSPAHIANNYTWQHDTTRSIQNILSTFSTKIT